MRIRLGMIAAFLLVAALGRADSTTPKTNKAQGSFAPDPSVERYRLPLGAAAPVKGPPNARVTIVQFSDFQCPFCARVEPTLAEVMQKYPNDVRVVWKNMPLPFHVNAMPAARLAMAAHTAGKFWELHDTLFKNQQKLDAPSLAEYASAAGIAQPREGSAYDGVIQADVAEAKRVGANGTPTFFINGRILVGAQPLEKFTAMVDEELVTADKALKAGVQPAHVYDVLVAHGKEKYEEPPARPGSPAADEDKTVHKIELGGAPIRGEKRARVTIVEWSDFQCPFCSRANATLATVMQKYKGRVRLVFKHLPLPFHDHAHLAAEASLEANAQGKFWELHDKLFANQQRLERADLDAYAAAIGLDLDRWKTALDGGKWKQRVDDDAKQGAALGASGTPTFFINGRILVGAQPVERFSARIDEELKL